VTNCVTITTHDHGLRWILKDADQGKPAEMRWSGHYCYCFSDEETVFNPET